MALSSKNRTKRERDSSTEEESSKTKRPRLERKDANLGMFFSLNRTRSEIMRERLGELPDISEDKQYFRTYRILTSNLSDFSLPIASISACLTSNREILILDQTAKKLICLYNKFNEQFAKPTPNNVLTFVSQFKENREATLTLEKVNNLLKKWRDDNQGDPQKVTTALKGTEQIPIIPLEVFLENKACLCRHLSLFTVFLLSKLIQADKIKGAIYHRRDDINGIAKSAHSWAIFIPALCDQEEVYILDPILPSAKALELHRDRAALTQAYGEKSVERMERIYWSAPQPLTFKK